LVTAALGTGVRTYLVGAALYLPEEWLTATARQRAYLPASVTFQQRWRLALTLLRQVRASRLRITAVVADAEFGDNRMFRGQLHRLGLPYAVGVSRHLRAFLGTPRLLAPRSAPGPHRRRVAPDAIAGRFEDLLATAKPRWRRIRWRNRRGARAWAVECAAIRVTPALDHRHPRLLPEVWLLAEREPEIPTQLRFYYVHLPPTASLRQIVRLAHQRWAIEQQYQELKTELGLDHFEGRTWPGWHHHVVLTAMAYNFLQAERRHLATPLTFPAVRAIVQEIFTAYLFAQRPQYLTRIEALRSVELRI
jgi:SRSO17 transposase